MSVTGIVLIWVWTVVVFAIFMKWPMGGESNVRQKYWSKYEDK